MERVELEARALARAKARNIHVFAIPGRPGCYTVTSASEPGVKHYLVVRGEEVACDCKGYTHRKNCCHVEAAKCRLAREAVQVVRAQRALPDVHAVHAEQSAQPVRALPRATADDLYAA